VLKMIKISVKILFQPTEEYPNLIRVLQNVLDFKESEIQTYQNDTNTFLSIESSDLKSLQKFYEAIRTQKIVQAARKFLMPKMDASGVSFLLHKQGMFMGKFHFCDNPYDSPMGPVWVRIESDNIERLLEYLTPQTEHGVTLEVDYIPE
jgi:predicted RNA binding protein with dsRBD fold (UPF0201 family)